MECYWEVIDHMEIWSIWWNKMEFLLHVHTTVWVHLMATNKTHRKKLDVNYTRILQAVLNKSWKQHTPKQQLYSHLSPISQTIQVRWTRHVRHCWRSKDELTAMFFMESYTWTCQCWPTINDLHTSALCRYRMQTRRPARSDG